MDFLKRAMQADEIVEQLDFTIIDKTVLDL